MEDLYRYKYRKYKHKYNSLRKRMQRGGSDQPLKCILFKAEWCGHCKEFKPTWKALETMYEKNGKIKFVTYDFDKNKKKMEEYGIEGFPSIMFENNKGKSFYKGSRDVNDLMNIIEQYLANL